MKEANITSINTYKKGLNDLIRYGVVSQTTIKDTFWINPEFFFKGSRTGKYPDKILKY